VYDLIGLEAGQAAGAVILLFLLLIAGCTAAWIWSYRAGGVRLETPSQAQTFTVKKKECLDQHLLGHSAGLTTIVNQPGNSHLPAQGQGYRRCAIRMVLA